MKKRILCILLAVMMIVSAMPYAAVSVSAANGYNGTPLTPQKITSSNYQKFGLTSENFSAITATTVSVLRQSFTALQLW